MGDAEYLERFERRAVGGSFYARERATGKRTRLYINPEAAQRAVERGELYTDAEYAALMTLPAAAAGRKVRRAA
jgi:hypothetical protein